jgi:hypothetical protein
VATSRAFDDRSFPKDVTVVAPVTPTTHGNGVPAPGDEMFPVLLAEAVRDGHITHSEAEQQYALHRLVEMAAS